MKRRDLLKKLAAISKDQGLILELLREGGDHSVYQIKGTQIVIPRHNEINTPLKAF